MRLLVDTHALLWWAFDDRQLSRRARALIADRQNAILVSAASAWEIATKFRLGRLPEVKVLVQDMPGWFAEAGLVELPVKTSHAQRASELAAPHRDPFDRMLAAQCLVEGLAIVGKDPVFREFGVDLLW